MKNFCFIFSLFIFFAGCSKDNEQETIEVKKLDEHTPVLPSPSEESDAEEITDQNYGEEKSLITPKEAKLHIGRELTVEGYVADVFKSDRVAYLNFDKRYPNNTFSGVIFPSNFDMFDDIYAYKNKTVRLNGTISEYRGKPQIIIDSESQLEIVK